MKPIIIIHPADNGYILEAQHPETNCRVGLCIATETTSTYDRHSLNSCVEKLMTIECHSAEAAAQPELFDVEDKPPVAWA